MSRNKRAVHRIYISCFIWENICLHVCQATEPWPCQIESKPATESGGVSHRRPHHRLKFPTSFCFNTTLPWPFSSLSPPQTPTPPHLNSSSGTYFIFLPVFTDTYKKKKKKVCFGAINAGMLFPFFTMHIVYEYLKVSGGIYGPVPPLVILSV